MYITLSMKYTEKYTELTIAQFCTNSTYLCPTRNGNPCIRVSRCNFSVSVVRPRVEVSVYEISREYAPPWRPIGRFSVHHRVPPTPNRWRVEHETDARPTRASLREHRDARGLVAAGNHRSPRGNPTPCRRLCGAEASPTCGLWHLLNLTPASSPFSLRLGLPPPLPAIQVYALCSRRILDTRRRFRPVFCRAIYEPPSTIATSTTPIEQ